MGLSLLLLLQRLPLLPLASLLLLSLLLIFPLLLIFCLSSTLGKKVFNNVFKSWLRSSFLNLKPVHHDCVFELHRQSSSALFFLVVYDHLTCAFVAKEMLLTVGVYNYVVKGRLIRIGIDKLNFFLDQSLIKLVVLLSKRLYFVDAYCVVGDGSYAFCIGVDSVVHEEGILVENASSEQLFDDELLASVERVKDIDLPALNHKHLLGVGVHAI